MEPIELEVGGIYGFEDGCICEITDITGRFVYYQMVPRDGIGRWREPDDFKRGMTSRLRVPAPTQEGEGTTAPKVLEEAMVQAMAICDTSAALSADAPEITMSDVGKLARDYLHLRKLSEPRQSAPGEPARDSAPPHRVTYALKRIEVIIEHIAHRQAFWETDRQSILNELLDVWDHHSILSAAPLEPLSDEGCWHYEDGKHRPCTQGCTDEEGHPDVPHCEGCAEDLPEPLTPEQKVRQVWPDVYLAGNYSITDHPDGFDVVVRSTGKTIGSGRTRAKAWANAAASLSPAATDDVTTMDDIEYEEGMVDDRERE